VTHGLLLRSRCCSASRTGATEPWPHETDYIPPRVCESGVLRHPGTAGTARPNLSPRLRPPLFVHSRGGGLQAVDIRDTVLPPGKTAVGGRVHQARRIAVTITHHVRDGGAVQGHGGPVDRDLGIKRVDHVLGTGTPALRTQVHHGGLRLEREEPV